MEELREVRDRLLSILGLIGAAIVCGAAGYRFIEGWSWLDSVYMTVITLATVGYGETRPLDTHGRVFTMLLILGGIGLMTYAFSMITSVIVEGELTNAFKRRRMQREIGKLEGHYIICGGGHAGGVIGAELKRTRRPFVVIDSSEDTLKKFTERLGEGGFFTIVGDATLDETLKAAGIDRASGVFAVLHTDQDNAFVALSAKGLNAKARVVSAQRELGVREKLFRSGADSVINPAFISGMRMASEMIRPATTGFLDSMLREKDSIVRFDEIVVPEGSPMLGQPIETVRGAGQKAPLLMAILEPKTGRYEINPEPGRPIVAGEKLVMLGEVGQMAELRKKVGA